MCGNCIHKDVCRYKTEFENLKNNFAKIYWDEESMNKAKRGIVTDREYTNQYILLTKADNKKGE